MRIGIDARFYNESGVGRYLRNLIRNLKVLDKKNQYFIFLLPKDYEQFAKTKNFQGVCADFAWYGFAEQFKLPKLLNKYKLDLVHFPHFNVPIFYESKFVVTIHDLIHQHHKMNRATTLSPLTYKVKQFGYRKVFKTAIIRSEKILVPSNYVKNVLISEWGVKKEKMMVTYEAVDREILTIASKMKMADYQKVLQKFNIQSPFITASPMAKLGYSLPRKFIFYVGNAHPHKNVEGLIRVFGQLREKYPNLQLVLSGFDHFFWQRIKKEFQHKDIIYTGSVSDEEMVAFYKNAACFVMPSFEEGFGIPLLEAMACGVPVVSSSRGSLPEVGGDAAIYFNPDDIENMTSQIDRVLRSEKLRQEKIKMGSIRVKQFSWEKLAKQTLEVYQQCV